MKFHDPLISAESLGYVHRLAGESARVLKAAIAKDTEAMAEIFEYTHQNVGGGRIYSFGKK